MLNKATTIIQVSEDKHKVNDKQVYQLKYLKNRNTKRLPSIHFDYDESTKSLVELDEDTLKALKDSHKMKANNTQMAEALRVIFQSNDNIKRQQLLVDLQNELNIKGRLAIDRLSEFYDSKNTIQINGRTFILSRNSVGNSHQYFLTETNS
jgi:CRISPR/Cas system CMR-associated protein Cmr1 (group 7 of RAMP superfamily)